MGVGVSLTLLPLGGLFFSCRAALASLGRKAFLVLLCLLLFCSAVIT